LAFILLTGATAVSAGTPTVHEVYEAAQAGRLNEAQGMIQQVLKEHPDSAKAHYVDAELLAKAGHAAEARNELNKAQQLEPGLPFVKPQAVQELRLRIGELSGNSGNLNPPHPAQGGFSLAWIFLGIGALVLIGLIVRMVARRAATTSYSPGFQGGVGSAGYMPGTQAAPAAPGMGSNILSGLATGAALGAGMVAGEELVRHFTEGNANGAVDSPGTTDSWETDPNRQMGGMDFGMNDNAGWDDGSNMADMSGGDDWS
jgi:hypothetical protein